MTTLSFVAGCAGGPDELAEGENVGVTHQAIVDENGIEPNGITANGITANGITANGITANGITANGITANGLIMSALTNSTLTQKFFTYLVSCALPEGQSVTLNLSGTPTTFFGSLGLAPQWGIDSGSCDTQCQEWVSACMLSRVNYLGLHVTISERGSLDALSSTPQEQIDFPHREGAYWGNIFTFPQIMYACSDVDRTWITRSSGPLDIQTSTFPGAITIIRQDCDDYCDAPSPVDGSYTNCKDLFGIKHSTVVTVFRQ